MHLSLAPQSLCGLGRPWTSDPLPFTSSALKLQELPSCSVCMVANPSFGPSRKALYQLNYYLTPFQSQSMQSSLKPPNTLRSECCHFKTTTASGAGEMAQHLRTLYCFPRGQFGTQGQLTSTCNSSSKRSNVLFGFMGTALTCTRARACAHTHVINKLNHF